MGQKINDDFAMAVSQEELKEELKPIIDFVNFAEVQQPDITDIELALMLLDDSKNYSEFNVNKTLTAINVIRNYGVR
ncbi:hypothetical protein G3C70_004689 [Salmonella enterica]|nr:hypothetical protein [Salmonella enterica]